MIKTKEELKKQAEKIGLKRWVVNHCSFCNYPCGYKINGNIIEYDCGCDCISYHQIEIRDWDDLTYSYNLNQPENNSKISKEYLKELNEIWKFDYV